MAVWAKQLQIINYVISMIPINMMDLEHQFFSIPLAQSTNLTVSIPSQDSTNVFPF